MSSSSSMSLSSEEGTDSPASAISSPSSISSLQSLPENQEPYFHFELNQVQVRLLLNALRSVSLTAACPEEISLAGTGKLRDSGHLCVSRGGAQIVATSPLPPHVETSLQIPLASVFPSFRCLYDSVLRLDLRLLEERIASTIADGLSLSFTGEKAFQLLYCLRNGTGDVVHSSEITLISRYRGQIGGDLSDEYVVSVEIPAGTFQQLINQLSLQAFTVKATMTSTEIRFCAADMEVVMRADNLEYRILEQKHEYPFAFGFTLYKLNALRNAIGLSD